MSENLDIHYVQVNWINAYLFLQLQESNNIWTMEGWGNDLHRSPSKDMLPRFRNSVQQTVSNCQLFQGLDQYRVIIPKEIPLLDLFGCIILRPSKNCKYWAISAQLYQLQMWKICFRTSHRNSQSLSDLHLSSNFSSAQNYLLLPFTDNYPY